MKSLLPMLWFFRETPSGRLARLFFEWITKSEIYLLVRWFRDDRIEVQNIFIVWLQDEHKVQSVYFIKKFYFYIYIFSFILYTLELIFCLISYISYDLDSWIFTFYLYTGLSTINLSVYNYKEYLYVYI